MVAEGHIGKKACCSVGQRITHQRSYDTRPSQTCLQYTLRCSITHSLRNCYYTLHQLDVFHNSLSFKKPCSILPHPTGREKNALQILYRGLSFHYGACNKNTVLNIGFVVCHIYKRESGLCEFISRPIGGLFCIAILSSQYF